MDEDAHRQLSTGERSLGTDQSFPVGHPLLAEPSHPTLHLHCGRARERVRVVEPGCGGADRYRSELSEKLVRGSRCPSQVTAERIIDVLPLSEGDRRRCGMWR